MTRRPSPLIHRFAQPGGRGSSPLRRLDRTLGVALLMALGTLRRGRPAPAAPRRIGIMKTTGIGDAILASAVVRDVVAAFPRAEVVVFAGVENAGLARLVEGARVVEIPAARPWAALPLLRAERLDVLVDMGQWARLEALYAALSGARWTVGFSTPGQRRHYAYDATVVHSDRMPELDNLRRLVAPLGVESASEPRFELSEQPAPPPAPDPYVVFHLWPGGFRSELREWPQESWRELARRMVGEDFSIVLTGGPGDAERTDEFLRSCGELAGGLVSIAGRCRLPELVDVLARAHCVVSVNTGVMHLAAATGVPTVGLNGPTSALRWGPVGPRAVSVDSDLPGCGFLNLGFEYDGRRTDCMSGISVDRVMAAAREGSRV
ncbi:MAG TPA: glycosyltransferase family 9 protein [Solirubrobacteraceae bacterium]|nr:glycosyltransferase family 9 protein [Solirubrobacteraceae bacterium]